MTKPRKTTAAKPTAPRKAKPTTRKAKPTPTVLEPKVEEGALPPAPAPVAAPSAPSERVLLGTVEAQVTRVPIDAVLGILGENSLRRIEAHKGSASVETVRKQMLATDGRATPVIFEDGDPPSLLHGYDEICAAMQAGVNDLSVIMVPAGAASEAQSYIVEMVRLSQIRDETTEDEDLVWRVNAED